MKGGSRRGEGGERRRTFGDDEGGYARPALPSIPVEACKEWLAGARGLRLGLRYVQL